MAARVLMSSFCAGILQSDHIAGVTSFLDTLGIGNCAQITALFKLRGRPPDELIPGTLNIGNAVGILFSARADPGAGTGADHHAGEEHGLDRNRTEEEQ